ncbi:hypothetical protein LTR82_008200 [Friedmanniomyces endolithicus]|uniref:Uncharacterized protein n=2 Tax=Friedmanniomyces endolithicus TaxID=329885 RepID=A0AAN6FQF4_9PEZI|nr:hypothetical protein LTR82_008200 [Friedmanniomyces endolithicus]
MPSMIKIAMAAATAFGVFTAAGKHNPSVDFVHFSQPDCPADYQLRKQPFDLDGNQCHTFKASMPPFESFKTVGKWSHPENVYLQGCHIVVYDQPKCQGTAYTVGVVADTHYQCANVPSRHGRSVKLVCGDHPISSSAIRTTTISIPTIPSSTTTTTVSIPISASATIPAPSSTTTTTVSAVLPMSTVTVAAEMTTISLSAISSPCTHGCNCAGGRYESARGARWYGDAGVLLFLN